MSRCDEVRSWKFALEEMMIRIRERQSGLRFSEWIEN